MSNTQTLASIDSDTNVSAEVGTEGVVREEIGNPPDVAVADGKGTTAILADKWYLYQETHESVRLLVLIGNHDGKGNGVTFSFVGNGLIAALSPLTTVTIDGDCHIKLKGAEYDILLPLIAGEVSVLEVQPLYMVVGEGVDAATQKTRDDLIAIFNSIAMVSDYQRVNVPFCSHGQGVPFSSLPSFPNTKEPGDIEKTDVRSLAN